MLQRPKEKCKDSYKTHFKKTAIYKHPPLQKSNLNFFVLVSSVRVKLHLKSGSIHIFTFTVLYPSHPAHPPKKNQTTSNNIKWFTRMNENEIWVCGNLVMTP